MSRFHNYWTKLGQHKISSQLKQRRLQRVAHFEAFKTLRRHSILQAGGIKEGESIAVHNQHDALAAKLLEGGLENLDGATVAAAAKGLRDTAVLESQLLRARAVGPILYRQRALCWLFSRTLNYTSSWSRMPHDLIYPLLNPFIPVIST